MRRSLYVPPSEPFEKGPVAAPLANKQYNLCESAFARDIDLSANSRVATKPPPTFVNAFNLCRLVEAGELQNVLASITLAFDNWWCIARSGG